MIFCVLEYFLFLLHFRTVFNTAPYIEYIFLVMPPNAQEGELFAAFPVKFSQLK